MLRHKTLLCLSTKKVPTLIKVFLICTSAASLPKAGRRVGGEGQRKNKENIAVQPVKSSNLITYYPLEYEATNADSITIRQNRVFRKLFCHTIIWLAGIHCLLLSTVQLANVLSTCYVMLMACKLFTIRTYRACSIIVQGKHALCKESMQGRCLYTLRFNRHI